MVKTQRQKRAIALQEAERNKDLVVQYARLLEKGRYSFVELKRLATFLRLPLSSTIGTKRLYKSVETLTADIKAKWDAEWHVHGDSINVPPPTGPKGAHAKGRSAT